jgi:hypothetical protein
VQGNPAGTELTHRLLHRLSSGRSMT